ncbi:MAG: hypothetical protein WC222_01315 [Parachlamydiales bacterium]|jgi:hypothetical protein
MRKHFLSQVKNAVWGSLLLASLCTLPLQAADSPKEKLTEWISSYPWIGLVAKDVSYGPITLRDLNLANKGRLVIVKPGEHIHGTVKYKIDSDRLESWNMYHVILGIKGQEAQSCITHSVGVWDKKGKANFTLVAPMEKGVYEVRFDLEEAIVCSDAMKEWRDDNPSSRATVGVIIVE